MAFFLVGKSLYFVQVFLVIFTDKNLCCHKQRTWHLGVRLISTSCTWWIAVQWLAMPEQGGVFSSAISSLKKAKVTFKNNICLKLSYAFFSWNLLITLVKKLCVEPSPFPGICPSCWSGHRTAVLCDHNHCTTTRALYTATLRNSTTLFKSNFQIFLNQGIVFLFKINDFCMLGYF